MQDYKHLKIITTDQSYPYEKIIVTYKTPKCLSKRLSESILLIITSQPEK